jgi:transcriptional regulator with XRE-family HTH domain
MKTNTVLRKFGDKVKALRLKKGWSQEHLAHRADLHRTYIGSIERYERNVSLLNVERIAKAFGVKAKDLI